MPGQVRTERVRESGEDTVEELPAKRVGETAVAGVVTDEMLGSIDQVLDEEASRAAALEKLLEEVDLLLEPNAQQFVESFVQKGGE